MVTDHTGVLQRLLRLGRAPAGGWTRTALLQAGRDALAKLPKLAGTEGASGRYAPGAAMEDHVRASHPTCTGPACNYSARICDIDHCTPWPAGPTAVNNLTPRHRRCHRWKTLGLWRSTLHADGSVTWRTHSGSTWTYRPDPLPGFAPGEGYAADLPGNRTTADPVHPAA